MAAEIEGVRRSIGLVAPATAPSRVASALAKSAICIWTWAWPISSQGSLGLRSQAVAQRAQRRAAVAAAGQRRHGDPHHHRPALRVDPGHLGHVLLAVGLAAHPAEHEGAQAEVEASGRPARAARPTGSCSAPRPRRCAPPTAGSPRADRREIRAPVSSQSAPPPWNCARAVPHTVSRAANAPTNPRNARCIGAIWHSPSALCIRRLPDPAPPPILPPTSPARPPGVSPMRRRPSQ